MRLFMESFRSWSRRKGFQKFHLSHQIGLGRQYSVDRLMFFRLSQNYVPHSCHHCSRRDQSQTSEVHQGFVPSYDAHCCKMTVHKEIPHWPNAMKPIYAMFRRHSFGDAGCTVEDI
uniref:Uncharacterized protein n=1 Tax=Arundo donax TaxID=35708 RepID=A0A0A9E5C0_ARUDO